MKPAGTILLALAICAAGVPARAAKAPGLDEAYAEASRAAGRLAAARPAASAAGSCGCSADVPRCSPENTASAPEGFRCVTTKCAVFTRVRREGFGAAWQGPDGTVWSREMTDASGRRDLSQDAGRRLCAARGARLPSRDDFKRGETQGFREALTDFGWNDYWTASMNEDSRFFGIGVTRGPQANFNDEIFGGLRFFIEQTRILPFVPVTYRIRCVATEPSR